MNEVDWVILDVIFIPNNLDEIRVSYITSDK